MLGRRDEADYPMGADLYPFTATVRREAACSSCRACEAAFECEALAKGFTRYCRRTALFFGESCTLERSLAGSTAATGLGGGSVPAFEGVGRQFAELFAVVVGEASQVQEAIIHGHFRDVAHVARRVAQAQVDALELFLPDVVLR